MSWLSNVRNALSRVVASKETPDNLWHKCKGCGQMVFTKELEENLWVCPKCDHHERIGPKRRFAQVFDEGSCDLVPAPKVPEDPLKFRDSKRYADRIKAARASTSEPDALLNARGTIHGRRAVVGVQDFAFMGGSMGLAVGEAFVRGVETAIRDAAPYIIFTAAGGARMQEGILSLMQMPRATVAIQMLHDAGLPYIVVLTDPTTGGVTASYAMLGDVQIAEPGALIGSRAPGSSRTPFARSCRRGSSAPNTSWNTACSTWWSTAATCATAGPGDRLPDRRPRRVAPVGEFDRVFARHRRDAVLLHRPYPPHSAPRTNSHVGGLPRLPGHHEWPRTSKGVPLHFLAQVDCAELPFPSALPDRGVLFFFGRDDAEQVWNYQGPAADDCRVLYLLDAFAATPLRAPPADLPPIGDEYHRRGSRDFLRRGEVGPNVHTGWPVVLRRMVTWPGDLPNGWTRGRGMVEGLRDLLTRPRQVSSRPFGDFTLHTDERDGRYREELDRRRAAAFTESTGEASLYKTCDEEPNQDGAAAARVFFHAEHGPDAWPQHWIGVHYAARRLLHRPEYLTPSRHPRFMGPLVANAEAWLARADAAGLTTPVPPADKAEFRTCMRKLRKPRYEQELGGDAQRVIFSALVATVQHWAGTRELAALIPPHIYEAVRFQLNGFWNADPTFAQILGHAPSAQESRSLDDPTVCLLNLASDDGMGWMFGDVGNASFWISPDDLARRDFAKAWATIEGY